jgi:hypothetical protein
MAYVPVRDSDGTHAASSRATYAAVRVLYRRSADTLSLTHTEAKVTCVNRTLLGNYSAM